MTNCYWIEEQGAFEVCVEESLPPLPGDYVVIDPTPQSPDPHGRTMFDDGYHGATYMGLAASPDIIVAAFTTNWGDPNEIYTPQSYLVCVSDDHGFTFSPGLDKYPWQLGTDAVYLGYIASLCLWDSGPSGWVGHNVVHDEEYGDFAALDCTQNDEGRLVSKIRLSRSVDGVNWTTVLSDDIDYTPVLCDSYNGIVYYVGYNTIGYWCYGDDDWPNLAIRTSTDGGVSWSGTILTGSVSYEPYSQATEHDVDISANAQGLHVYNSAWGNTGLNVYYIRPTSTTTWATPVILFANIYNVLDEEARSILASRVRPGEVYINLAGAYTSHIKCRRSTDNGVTWGAEFTSWLDPTNTVGFADSYLVGYCKNKFRIVELDNGRLVMIGLMYYVGNDSKIRFGYAVSEDGLATPFGAMTMLLPDNDELNLAWPTVQYGQIYATFEVTAKGNDVVIGWSNNWLDIDGITTSPMRTLVFRP